MSVGCKKLDSGGVGVPRALSGIYTHAQRSMTTAKSPAGQERVESVGQVKVAAKYAEIHGNLKPVSLVPAAKHRTGPLATHIDNLGLSLAGRPRWNPKPWIIKFNSHGFSKRNFAHQYPLSVIRSEHQGSSMTSTVGIAGYHWQICEKTRILYLETLGCRYSRLLP